MGSVCGRLSRSEAYPVGEEVSCWLIEQVRSGWETNLQSYSWTLRHRGDRMGEEAGCLDS